VQAVGDFILLEKVTEPQTVAGFDVPGSQPEPVFTVLSVGPEVVNCNEGDKIVSYHEADPIHVDGKEYWLVKNDQVALVIK
jgi:hypothetical protein